MTISSIHANQPGTVGNTGEMYTPDARSDAAGKTPAAGTLQEVTDQAKLSSLAPRIQAVLSEITGSENNVLHTLSANVEKLQEGFIDTLYTTLSENDVDLTQKMTLRLDRNSSLTVAGEHPEKERVDAILSQNPTLSTAFGEIASQSEVLRDLANISKVMTRHTGMEAYAASGADKSSYSIYQMSLKGEMSHFYFSRT